MKPISETYNVEELAGAWHKLAHGEWDERILGESPPDFDRLPLKENRPHFRKRTVTKSTYTKPAMKAIERMIGMAEIMRYDFLINRGETEEAWFRFFITSTAAAGNNIED